MNILITGIHGFVGSNLVKALSSEHAVYGLDIISPNKEGIIRTFSWNDLEKDVIPPMDAIIHLAGKAHDTKNQAQASVYFAINTDLTKKIYDYFLQKNISKFIFFSSIKAAADVVLEDVLTESVVPTPKGPYGESKIAAEKYILSHPEKATQTVYILRPCMIHGPGNKGNLNLLYQVVHKGIPWPLGSYDNKRTFTSIDNLTFIIESLLEKPILGGIYHIADDEAVSTNDLIKIIALAKNKAVHIYNIPPMLIQVFSKIGDYLHLPLNTERLQKLTENYVASNAKIKKALHIDKMPVHAKDGLMKTIQSFKD